ncbi:L-lactate permease [Dietzia kunjamensis]|uniref:L-lactate permease n=1 Tax=Dietzia kunjamensis TaxID=322509 RepID=UPI0032AE9157
MWSSFCRARTLHRPPRSSRSCSDRDRMWCPPYRVGCARADRPATGPPRGPATPATRAGRLRAMSELVPTGVAVAPVVVVLALLAFRVPSLVAGTAGLVAALAGAVTVFRPDDDEVATAAVQLGPTVLEVALILLGGVLLATALSATGSRDHIAGWLERIGSGGDRVPAILLLVFGLTPFMESVTGFGLGVVITAPLLVRMGLPPVKAVVVDSPMGRVSARFLPRNELGVLDHEVTLSDGTVTYNPLRVVPHPEGAEVVFTLRGVDDGEFERDAAMVAEHVLPSRRARPSSRRAAARG